MTAYWILIWLLLMTAVTRQQNNRRKRQMGPRIQISDSEFLKLAEKERGLVIRGPKMLWAGNTYLLRSGDYYYYTIAKVPLDLPKECQILESSHILL